MYIQVDNLHKIYVEETGKGIPVLCLHGGPGYPVPVKIFAKEINPKKYRIITFHQRGCGKSKPFGSLIRNTTKYLIEDIEKIRKHLEIDKWIVFGGSWGATLTVYYTIAHPKSVLAFVTFGYATFNDMMEESTKIMAPDVYDEWNIAKNEKKTMELYAKKLKSKEKKKYIDKWSYELKLFQSMNFPPFKKQRKKKSNKTKKKDLHSMALLENHYYRNKGFVPKNYVMKNIKKLKGIPAFLIHGRFDLICTPKNSFDLYKKLPGSIFIMTEMAGHGMYDKNNFLAVKKVFDSLLKKKLSDTK